MTFLWLYIDAYVNSRLHKNGNVARNFPRAGYEMFFPQILLPIAETCIRNASFEYILISVVYKNLERKIKEKISLFSLVEKIQ